MTHAGNLWNLLTAIILSVVPAIVSANAPPDISKEEQALLPRSCNYVQLAARTEQEQRIYKMYVDRFGQGWTHMHHYCWALIDILRLNRWRNQYAGYASWERALQNLNYVLHETEQQPKFAFRAEVLSRRARLLAQFSDAQTATNAARKMIEEWPEHHDGYLILAGIFVKSGQIEEARQVIRSGEQKVSNLEEFRSAGLIVLKK